MGYQPRTDDEIKEIAIGIHAGAIFCDRHLLDEPHMLGSVFMVVALMEGEVRKDFLDVMMPNGADGPMGMMYEYVAKAGPRSVNGYPMFFSVKYLDPDDTTRVFRMMKVLEEM